MIDRSRILPLVLAGLLATPAIAQDQLASEEELAVRMASPGLVETEGSDEFTVIELELQGCRVVQTLLTTSGRELGGPVGAQVLRIDLRDLEPASGIQPAQDTSTGNRRVMLLPSQDAWGQIQQAGGLFSQIRQAATAEGDADDPDGPNGPRAMRTRAHRAFSADAASGAFGPVMARTHVMQMRGDRGGLIYPLIAPMQMTLSPEGYDAALAAFETLRAGECAPEEAGE